MPTPHIDENVLDRYAMGTLPGAAIPQVEEHLLSCSFCQSRLLETDDFLTHFPPALTHVDLHTHPFCRTFRNSRRAAIGCVFIKGSPRGRWSGNTVSRGRNSPRLGHSSRSRQCPSSRSTKYATSRRYRSSITPGSSPSRSAHFRRTASIAACRSGAATCASLVLNRAAACT